MRDLGSLGFTFIFLFFSFLYFLLFSFFYFRRFRADCSCSYFFLLFFLSFYFLDLNDVDELKLNAEINFFSNYYLERMEFQTNSGIRLFQFPIAVILLISRMLYGVIQ